MDEALRFPFGSPDGSQLNPSQVEGDFVAFNDPVMWGPLATSRRDLDARLFVGRKGSGKTLYLRHLEVHVSGMNDAHACPRETRPPSTDVITTFRRNYATRELREEAWTLAWDRAILLAAASRILYDRALGTGATPDEIVALKSAYEALHMSGRADTTSRGIYSELNTLLMTARGTAELRKRLNSPGWDTLRETLLPALRGSKRLCFFVDNIDEHYESAPFAWLECEVGFFRAVVEFTRDNRFDGLLHVFATAREEVFSRLQETENATRYQNESHIRILEWNRAALLYLLDEKIARLDNRHLSEAKASLPLQRWLGRTSLTNGRNNTEPVGEYMLRHTRLLPRDLIIGANCISSHTILARQFAPNETGRDPISAGMSFAAAGFATEQLKICANRIMATWPSGHHWSERSSQKTAETVRIDLVDALKKALKALRQDRFGRKRMERLEASLTSSLGVESMNDVLWLAGLIGAVNRKSSVQCVEFYSLKPGSLSRFPRDRQSYAVHSVLHDVIDLLAVKAPVVQC